MKTLNYLEISPKEEDLEKTLKNAQNEGIDLLVVTNSSDFDYKEALQKECESDCKKKVIHCFTGKILGLFKIPVIFDGRVIQIKIFTNNITRTVGMLKRNILPKNIRNLREHECIKNRFCKMGLKFDIKNIKFNPTKESSLKAWFDEISKYDENKKYLLFESSFESFKNFSRDESYNPKSRLFINRGDIYPNLENVLMLFNREIEYTMLTTVDKIEVSGDENFIDFIDYIMYNFDIDGIELRSLRYSELLTKKLSKYCEDNDKYVLKKSRGLKKISGNHNLSNNVIGFEKKAINT